MIVYCITPSDVIYGGLQKSLESSKKESQVNAECAHDFHEITISRYFIVLARKIGLWHLTAQSDVGTSYQKYIKP